MSRRTRLVWRKPAVFTLVGSSALLGVFVYYLLAGYSL